MKKLDFIILIFLFICSLLVKSSFGFRFLFLFYASLIIYKNIALKADKNKFFKFLKKICKLGYCLFFFSFIIVEGIILKDILVNRNNSPKIKYLIVLGAGLKGDIPSEVLKYRLNKAVKYFKENPDTIFIVSGGQGKDELISEAEAMEIYLSERGIPIKNIIKEDKSTSTYENLKFSDKIIKEKEITGDIAVMSNSFHMYRVKMISKKLNFPLKTVYAETPAIVFPNYMLREYFAFFNEYRKKEV
ncbi:YdcF family protein [Fusobacterium ulcerans]|uniref:YdcF family protein n=1 Tax=Fusobacterium ulcerans TaxID=861 RepID=UPI001DD4C847|nr:YdcF family protein [Fusobacterium ulcerans]MEE0137498.1 YdcF family protein [Fusobacterium ulcerans]HJH07893.1 YdcF family protein [Fusobacterium ulcerans]